MQKRKVLSIVAGSWLLAGRLLAFDLFFETRIDYPAGSGPYSVCAVDLNGDGMPDLAAANRWSDSISVLYNNGDGTFSPAINLGVEHEPLFVCAADIDGDGDSDLAVSNNASYSISILVLMPSKFLIFERL